jgi:hypothetical protein
MTRIVTTLLCLNILLASPALAASRTSTVSPHLKRAKIQQHVSFVPAYKPLLAVQKLQAPLSGQVSKQAIGVPVQSPSTLSAPVYAPQQSLNVAVAPSINTDRKSRGLWLFRHHLHSKIANTNSWVVNLPASDAVQLSEVVAQLIQKQIPDRTIPLQLQNVPGEQIANPFTLSLAYALKIMGYALCPSQNTPKAAVVRYRISRFNKSYLVRLKVNATETAWLYEKNLDGSLVAASAGTSIKEGND